MTGYKLSREAAATEARKERAASERKEIIGVNDALAGWSGASRQDGTNFRTNMVTLAQYMDAPSGNAVGLSATWACVGLLAGSIASLPLVVYRTSITGVRTVARDHPLHYILRESPNYDQTPVDFWEFMCAGVELQGNAYATIEKRSDGSVYSLTPIRPDIVAAKRLSNGNIEYTWTDDGKSRRVTQESIFHIRGFGGNPLGGTSTLSACRQIFSGALSAERAANGMFENGARPSGILGTNEQLTAPQREAAEGLLIEKFVGSMNSGRPMLLDRGMTWTQLTMSPEDVQMLESRKFSGEEICRLFGVPPAMVGYGDKSSNWGTGKEVDVLGFIKFTLRRRIKRIEQALMKQLLTSADRLAGITIEFNLEGLLRGDTESRFNSYEKGIRMGIYTRNEVRALENLPPVDGGDVVTVQMQDVPLSQATTPQAGQEAE